MCCKSWKTFLPFLVTFTFGVFMTIAFQSFMTEKKSVKPINAATYSKENGGGSGGQAACLHKDDTFEDEKQSLIGSNSKNKSLQILLKPRAEYPNSARVNQTQGTVTLRVTFLANGQIGSVSPISSLPDGLTEECIKAAKKIKFEPATRNGQSYTVTKLLKYTFTIY